MSDTNRDDWEFVYDKPTEDFPKGYYLHKPTNMKYCFDRGIKDKVSKDDEQYIYDGWWLNNG